MSSNSIIKLSFAHEWKVLNNAVKGDPNLEVKDFANAFEAATFLSNVKFCLIIASLVKKEDITQVVTLNKIYKKVAPETVVKVVVVNFSGDKFFEKAVAKLGIQDVIDPGISAKAIKFKIDFWIKGLAAQAAKAEGPKGAGKINVEGKAAAEIKVTDVNSANWKPPMECVDDIWLVKSDADCKRILGKWMLRLMAPSPSVANWTEVNGRNNLWKFEFRKGERESFLDEDGNWYFKGDQKPEFIWKDNVWLFTGNQYELYYQDSKDIRSRLALQNKVLTVCKNSKYARIKEGIIKDSFDRETVFKNEGQITTYDEVDTEGGTDRLKNLEGKGKTDHYSNGPLKGKSDGADDLTGSLLGMDLEPGDNHIDDGKMSGPASDGPRSGGPMWGPASGPVREGTELDLENEDNEHKNHWKGAIEGEQIGAKEKERKRHTSESHSDYSGDLDQNIDDGDGGDYGGKGGTDKLNQFYGNAHQGDGESGKKNPESQGDDISDLQTEREKKRAKKAALEAKERELAENEKDVNSGADTEDHLAPLSRANRKSESKDKEVKIRTSSVRKSQGRGEWLDEDEFGSGFSSKKERPLSEEKSSGVASLQETRQLKELQNTLREQYDPELDEATQSAQVMTYLTQQENRISCKLDDFFDQTIIFSTLDQRLSGPSEVELDMSFDYLKKVTKLNFKGLITEVVNDGDGTRYLTVKIPDESVRAFDAFMKLYQVRQKNINFFLSKVKGFA